MSPKNKELSFMVRTKVYQSQNVSKQELFHITDQQVECEFTMAEVSEMIDEPAEEIAIAKKKGREALLPLMERLKHVI